MDDLSRAVLQDDLRTMSSTQLRAKYRREYNSWSNMKRRALEGRARVHDEFVEFRSFLHHVGPAAPNHTLDRPVNPNPLYSPETVRWLDPTGQANNRSTTVYLDVDGVQKPLSVWARETEQNPDTLRRRRRQGWSPSEIVYGKKKSAELSTNIYYAKPWHIFPVSQPQDWEKAYEDAGRFRETPVAFYARSIQAGLEALLARHSMLVDQFGMDAGSPEHDNLERVDQLISNLRQRLREGLKFHEQLSRARSSNGIKEPPGWTGPKRFKKRDSSI